MSEQPTKPTGPTESGDAPVNGLRMYYEIHGDGAGTPLLLLHGGLFNIDLQFGPVLPGLAAGRRVIAADFQGHGRTGDWTVRCRARAWPPTSSGCWNTWGSPGSTFT